MDKGWKYGGELIAEPVSKKVFQPAVLSYTDQIIGLPAGTKGDFYLMDFSDFQDPYPSQNLNFREQGQELELVVEHVLALTQAPQVILISHSMGGLAIRAYLQLGNPGTRVEKAIFIAAPHQGSEMAAMDEAVLQTIRNFFGGRNLSRHSKAVQALLPYSAEIVELSDFLRNPFPPSVKLTNAIVEDALVDFPVLPPEGEPNDGVVTFRSQDLTEIPGMEKLSRQTVKRFVFQEITASDPWPEFAHSRILNNNAFRNNLFWILDELEPQAKLPERYSLLRPYQAFLVELKRAAALAPVSVMIWAGGKRVFIDYLPVGQTDETGQFTLSATAPQTPGQYLLQFQVQGQVSNCLRLRVEEKNPLTLSVTIPSATPQRYEILAVVREGQSQTEVSLEGKGVKNGNFLLENLGKTDSRGQFQTLFGISAPETRLILRAKVGEDWSNFVALDFTAPRILLNLPFSLRERQLLRLSGIADYFEPSSAEPALVGLAPEALLQFPAPMPYLELEIETANRLLLTLTLGNGKELPLEEFSGKKKILLKQEEGVVSIKFQTRGQVQPLWLLRRLVAASDLKPPVLLAGFYPDPVPKGEPDPDGGYWRNWIYLSEPEDTVPLKVEGLEFHFFDAQGELILKQVKTKTDFQTKDLGWFSPDPLFSFSPLGRCLPLVRQTDGNLWFYPPGKICQELVYDILVQPEPRFVQMRFLVEDVFGNRQIASASAVMLAQ